MKKLIIICMTLLATIIIISCNSYTKNKDISEKVQKSLPVKEKETVPISSDNIILPSDNITVQNDNKIIAKRDNFFALITDGIILGGNNDGMWINSHDTEGYILGTDVFKFYSLDKFLGNGKDSKIEKSEDGNRLRVTKDFTSTSNEKEFFKWFLNDIAISGQWNALPRLPRLQEDKAVYEKVISEILMRKALGNSRVDVKQVIRIDIEGDGVDEVLVTATDWNIDSWHDSAMQSGKGTYSIVLLRKIINGKVENIILRGQFSIDKPEYEYVFYTPYILDIDNDGKMEVIVEGRFGASSIIEFYKSENSSMKKIYTTIFGA